MTRRTLLFDLGGVVLQNSTFERLDALLPAKVELQELKRRWLASESVRAFELGRTNPEDFADAFVAEWSLGCTADAFIGEFAGWPGGLYPGAADLLARLRRRHRTACLSNSNVLHWQRFDGFSEHFDLAFSSHLLGVIKPDVDCFELSLKLLDVDAGNVTFFDDSQANVEAAAQVGIHAIHVNGFDELAKAVATAQLLV